MTPIQESSQKQKGTGGSSLPTALKLLYLVDDEPDILFVMKKAIAEYAPHVVVRTFEDPQMALEALRTRPPDALVTDLRMPGVSGIELIWWAHRSVDSMPIVVASAFASPAMLSEVADRSSMEFIEKPFSSADLFDALTRAFNESEKQNAEFHGQMRLRGTLDLVQIHSMARLTGRLDISRAHRTGSIWFDEGKIVHAKAGELVGQGAFNRMTSWIGGEFTFTEKVSSPQISIRAATEHVLLEACLFTDNKNRIEEDPSTKGQPKKEKQKNIPVAKQSQKGEIKMGNSKKLMQHLSALDGFIGACVVNLESGMMLDALGGGTINMELASAGNAEVLRAKYKTMKSLNLKESIEDILITLEHQYHLLRPFSKQKDLFVYLVLDKSKANLAMGRHHLKQAETVMEI